MIGLIATMVVQIVGFVEIGPGVCQVDYLLDETEIVTKIIKCDDVTDLQFYW